MDQKYIHFSDHVVRCADEGGQERELVIVFELGPDEDFRIDDDVSLTLRTGRARFELLEEGFSIRASGESEAQLVYRLMKICGGQLLRVAKSMGLEIYQYRPGDVEQALDLFK
jgi:hypothetical protein